MILLMKNQFPYSLEEISKQNFYFCLVSGIKCNWKQACKADLGLKLLHMF